MRKIVGDLKPFTEYTFSVFAYNLRKNLSGPESAVSAMTDSAGINSFHNYVFKENSAPQTRKSNERVSLHDKLKLVCNLLLTNACANIAKRVCEDIL